MGLQAGSAPVVRRRHPRPRPCACGKCPRSGRGRHAVRHRVGAGAAALGRLMDALTASHRKDLSLMVSSVGLCALVAGLTTTWATMTDRSVEVLALCVTAMVVAILNRFPMYLYPTGELLLIPVLVIPTLVLFGLPVAVSGAALGIATGLTMRPMRSVLWDAGVVLPSLAAAAAGAAMVPSHVPIAGVEKVAAPGLA